MNKYSIFNGKNWNEVWAASWWDAILYADNFFPNWAQLYDYKNDFVYLGA